jgi:hypothetical protein
VLSVDAGRGLIEVEYLDGDQEIALDLGQFDLDRAAGSWSGEKISKPEDEEEEEERTRTRTRLGR